MSAPNVLVAYASKHGTTREVAEFVAHMLERRGLTVEVEEATRVDTIAQYDAVIVGGGLYMGRWHKDARRLLERHRDQLAGRSLAVFGMGPDSLEDSKIVESRKQLERSLAATRELEPVAVTVFGGALAPESWRFPFSKLPAFDARDWDAIEEWADEVAARISLVAV